MRNSVYIAASLDGFIADKDRGLQWLEDIPNPGSSDYGFSEFMDNIDAVVMGRNTFEKVLTFGIWPYTKKVFVLSSRLKELPEHLGNRASIVTGNIPDIVKTLNEEGFKNLYIDGGKTIQSFLEYDLIDEMIITRVSVVLGGGIPLFGEFNSGKQFKAVETEILNSSLVKTRFLRCR